MGRRPPPRRGGGFHPKEQALWGPRDALIEAVGKDAVAVRDFLEDLIEAVTKRDEGGKHSLANKIDVKENCSGIEIESKKK